MGGLGVSDNLGQYYAVWEWFIPSDSKLLCEYMSDRTMFSVIDQTFQLASAPLTTVIGTSMPEHLYPIYLTFEDYSNAHWQSLDVVIACFRTLLSHLQATPDVYAKLEATRLDLGVEELNGDTFADRYFVEGTFEMEISQLIQLLEHIQTTGATAIQWQGC